jgi:apolipoprotein N-acyltransferase
MAANHSLHAIAERIGAVSFRKQCLLMLLCGALCALALPPFGWWPLLPLLLPPLVITAMRAASAKRAFALGWCWGFGHHVAGLYWISNALLVEPEKFAWLVPFAVSLIPAALAVYIGIFAVLLRRCNIKGWRLMLCAALLWVGFEALRGTLFTGFPWNLMGYSWIKLDAMLQVASLAGVYGLSFLAMLLAFLPLALMEKKRAAVTSSVAVTALLLGSIAFGTVRLQQADAQSLKPESERIQVRVVQGNIAQHYKWEDATRHASFMKHLTLTQQGEFLEEGGAKKIIVWPETAVPYALGQDEKLLALLKNALPENAVLLTGALRVTPPEEQHFQIWNNIYAVNAKGVVGHYDKVHLVPFGEYVPLRRLLPFINKITHGSGDFSAGEMPKNIDLPKGFPVVAPLVCYEVIFSTGAIADTPEPDVIVNVTNDAWFGESTGPYQHLAMARVRAIEQGMPLIRAANTGISTVIDAYGRIIMSQPLGTEGVLDVYLPEKLDKTLFFYF